jgi:hypothetical protein
MVPILSSFALKKGENRKYSRSCNQSSSFGILRNEWGKDPFRGFLSQDI